MRTDEDEDEDMMKMRMKMRMRMRMRLRIDGDTHLFFFEFFFLLKKVSRIFRNNVGIEIALMSKFAETCHNNVPQNAGEMCYRRIVTNAEKR